MTTIAASRPARKRLATRPATRAPRRAAGPDAIAMLREDHKRVDTLFKRFHRIKDEAQHTHKQALVDEICVELAIHTTLEEELLYPAARDALGEKGHELLDEAEVEHATAKDLIAQLEAASPGEELYDAKVAVLGEYVRHHVKEEHAEMFPRCRKSGIDLESLGAQMRQHKAVLRGDA
jgi:hemerythrin superfamily protein